MKHANIFFVHITNVLEQKTRANKDMAIFLYLPPFSMKKGMLCTIILEFKAFRYKALAVKNCQNMLNVTSNKDVLNWNV